MWLTGPGPACFPCLSAVSLGWDILKQGIKKYKSPWKKKSHIRQDKVASIAMLMASPLVDRNSLDSQRTVVWDNYSSTGHQQINSLVSHGASISFLEGFYPIMDSNFPYLVLNGEEFSYWTSSMCSETSNLHTSPRYAKFTPLHSTRGSNLQ